MPAAGHDALRPGFADGRSHRLGAGRNDNGVSDVHFGDSLPDPDDEGESGEETEGFAGEAHGAEARRNDHKRPHYPPFLARHDAKVTLSNIRTGDTPGKRPFCSECQVDAEGNRRFTGEWRAVLGGIDHVINPQHAYARADANVLDKWRQSVDSRVPGGVVQGDEWIADNRNLDL